MTTPDAPQIPKLFSAAIARFIRIQEGRNRSPKLCAPIVPIAPSLRPDYLRIIRT